MVDQKGVQEDFIADLDEVLGKTRALLIEKNRKYGDSALNPVRITTKADPRELITARFDDKLKRLQSGQLDEDEDVWADLRGYAVLLGVYDLRQKRRVLAAAREAAGYDLKPARRP